MAVDLDRSNVSPLRGEKPQNRPVSKRNTGRAALGADPAGKKHHISSSHADVRRSISTKFCMVIEVVRAIILGLKRYWILSIVSPQEGVENLSENAPIEVNC